MGGNCCKSETTRAVPIITRPTSNPNAVTVLVTPPPSARVVYMERDADLSAGTADPDKVSSAAALSTLAAEPLDIRQQRIHDIYTRTVAPFRAHRCPLAEYSVKMVVGPSVLYLLEQFDVWYVYNDSPFYTATVDCRVGPDSALIPIPNIEMDVTEDGWHRVQATVGALQTVPIVAGTICGVKCTLTAQRLGNEDEECAENASEAPLAMQRVQQIMSQANNHDADAHAAHNDRNSAEAVLQSCLAHNTPFVDLTFPPTARSMWRCGIDASPATPTVTMLRPQHYLSLNRNNMNNTEDRDDGSNNHQAAVTIVDVVLPQAVSGGFLGDSWLTCAIALLAEREDVVRAMLAQTKPAEAALGAYRVVLCVNGWWQTVVVDDFMPTRGGVPVCAHSVVNINHAANSGTIVNNNTAAELWVSLLHKAYAKVKGSYAAVRGGEVLEALRDMTGWVGYRFSAQWQAVAAMRPGKPRVSAVRQLGASLLQYSEQGHMIILTTACEDAATTATNKSRTTVKSRKAQPNDTLASIGLMPGHSYCCDRVVQTTTAPGKSVWLLHMRNPWLRASVTGWRGAWSHGSAEWTNYPHAAKACGCAMPAHAHRETDGTTTNSHQSNEDSNSTDTGVSVTAASAAAARDASGNQNKTNDATSQQHPPPPQEEDGSFWISMLDAMSYFTGAAVLYCTAVSTTQYTAQGYFDNATPSVCVELTVSATSATDLSATVPVTVTLTQDDKRGLLEAAAAATAPVSTVNVNTSPLSAMYAPIMLSVARCAEDGRTFAVEMNSSADAAQPSAELQFGIAREVSVTMLLRAGSRYVLLPRVHHTASAPAAMRSYAVSLSMSSSSISNNANPVRVRADLRHIAADSPALQNRVRFTEADLSEASTLCQTYTMGVAPEQSERSVLCDVGGESSAEIAAMLEQQAHEAAEQHAEHGIEQQRGSIQMAASAPKRVPSEGSMNNDEGDITFTEDMTYDQDVTMPMTVDSDVRVVNQSVMA